jgi:ribosomal protein S12 methylthiotransferase accessory factor
VAAGVSTLAARLPAELRPVVSPRVGIVNALEECLVDVDEPPLVRVSCELAAGEEAIGAGLGAARNVGGSGAAREHALGAAVGEAIERYSACYVPHERLIEATAAQLGPHAADPASFALFDRTQYEQPGFPYAPFTPDTRVRWIDGVDLETGARVWLPAELVFLVDTRPPLGSRIGYATSSGLACGSTFDEALARGLFELLERDAFMLLWWRRLSPPRLDWGGHRGMTALDARYFRPTGVEYLALDLSCVHDVPIVVGVVRGAPGSCAALGVGAAAKARVEDAWLSALAEAFASRSACRKLRLLEPERRYEPDGSDVVDFDDHIRFYGDDEHADRASFLWASSETRAAAAAIPLSADRDELRDQLVARVRRAGSRAFAVDVTAPDVAAAGLRVVRAVAPGLCPLDAEHRCRFLGAQRLLEASEMDTLTGKVGRIEDLNQLPHPFP